MPFIPVLCVCVLLTVVNVWIFKHMLKNSTKPVCCGRDKRMMCGTCRSYLRLEQTFCT